MATGERCHCCDRVECPMPRYERMDCDEFDATVGIPGDDRYRAFMSEADDCRAHRVDWRSRAIDLQAELDKRGREANELEAQVEQMRAGASAVAGGTIAIGAVPVAGASYMCSCGAFVPIGTSHACPSGMVAVPLAAAGVPEHLVLNVQEAHAAIMKTAKERDDARAERDRLIAEVRAEAEHCRKQARSPCAGEDAAGALEDIASDLDVIANQGGRNG